MMVVITLRIKVLIALPEQGF